MRKPLTVYIGWDSREVDAYQVAVSSIVKQAGPDVTIHPIVRNQMMALGLYWRPQTVRDGRLWDVISDAPMATEFALTRFLIPHLGCQTQWALFIDCDMMAMTDLGEITEEATDNFALMCVQHRHEPVDGSLKMDGQLQTSYARKNWSSAMLWNLAHPAHRRLGLNEINAFRGLTLHQLCWLDDREIGALHPKWNYLVGHTKGIDEPALVHFTDGIPSMKGYEHCEFAEVWRNWRMEA